MNLTDQHIAIAKACGWTQIENANTMAAQGIWKGYPPQHQLIGKKEYIPDYTSDLNMMHEAQKTLTDEQAEKYWNILCHTVPNWNGKRRMWVHEATATQRAKAFLKTLNLWKD